MDIDQILARELAPVPTSMFTDMGDWETCRLDVYNFQTWKLRYSARGIRPNTL